MTSSGFRARLAGLAVCLLVTAGAAAAQTQDWSGTWFSQPSSDVEVIRLVPGTGSPRGWSGFIEALTQRADYRITVRQTADHVAVEFPGGAANMLTVPGFPVSDAPIASVENLGERWTQHRSMARWSGAALELTSTAFTGWFRTSSPERAQPKPTDFRLKFVLTAGASQDELLVHATLTDEKGEVEYRQRFRRVPGTPLPGALAGH